MAPQWRGYENGRDALCRVHSLRPFHFGHDEAWPSDRFVSTSQDSLYPSHLSILQHYFDAMWVSGALGQNACDYASRERPSALILLLDNLHAQTGVDLTALGWRHKLIPSLSYHRARRSSVNGACSRHVGWGISKGCGYERRDALCRVRLVASGHSHVKGFNSP